MATSEIEKQASASLRQKNAELEQMVADATAETAAVVRDRQQLVQQQNARLEYAKKATDAMSAGRQVFVDLTGGSLALVSTELVNWGIRWAGDWSKTGWLARNNDLLQALPHIGLGTVVYIAEMCTRPDPNKKLPGKWRAVYSEAAKLFAYSGFSNLARAVRYRVIQGKSMTEDNAALRAELAALKAAKAT